MHQRHSFCSQLAFVRLIKFQRTTCPQLHISKASEISSKNIIYKYMKNKTWLFRVSLYTCVVFAAFCFLFFFFKMSCHSKPLPIFSLVQCEGCREYTARWGHIQDVSDSTASGGADKIPCWSSEKFLWVDKSFSPSIITPGVLLSSRLSGQPVSSCQRRRAWHEARQPVLVQQLFFDG